jgi:serine/threonine-protein kinase
MATVYLAEDFKHDRKVAIKVLKPELAAVIGAERFLTEIKATAHLHQRAGVLMIDRTRSSDGVQVVVNWPPLPGLQRGGREPR